MSDHAQTFGPTPGTYTIDVCDSDGIQLVQDITVPSAWGCGGPGDDSPATNADGFAGNGSPSGGGGVCVSSVLIPNTDLANAIADAISNVALPCTLTVFIPDPADNSATTISLGGGALVLNPGEPGGACQGTGDQAEGGDLISDSLGWVTDIASQVSRGAPGTMNNHAQTAGYGGGSSGGLNGAAANDNNGTQTGGAAPDVSSGKGGDGGSLHANGQAGSTPGGGGGGGGLALTTATGGPGGGSTVTIAWNDAGTIPDHSDQRGHIGITTGIGF